MTQVEAGIREGLNQLQRQRDDCQTSLVQHVFKNTEFERRKQNFLAMLEQSHEESSVEVDKMKAEMDSLLKFCKISRKEFKKECKEKQQAE